MWMEYVKPLFRNLKTKQKTLMTLRKKLNMATAGLLLIHDPLLPAYWRQTLRAEVLLLAGFVRSSVHLVKIEKSEYAAVA